MIAVVLGNEKRRKISRESLNGADILRVGAAVSVKRVERALRGYDGFFCAENSGFSGGTDVSRFGKTVIIDELLSFVFSLPKGSEIGIFGGDKEDLELLKTCLNHCKSVTAVGCDVTDEFTEKCMREYGTAPTVRSKVVGRLSAEISFVGKRSETCFCVENIDRLTPKFNFTENLLHLPLTAFDRLRLAALLYPDSSAVWQPKILKTHGQIR